MPAICRIGDTGSHGGSLVTGSNTCKADGIPISRNGDTYDCEIHGPQPITCSSSVLIDGLQVATVGVAVAACGSIMTTGSSTTIAEN